MPVYGVELINGRYQLSEMIVKEYVPPLKEAASKVKSWVPRGFRSSKDEKEDASNKAPVPRWIELWIERPEIIPQIVRLSYRQ
jgi:hypothetical protein